jgi:Uncharacterized protein conserved in bacteria
MKREIERRFLVRGEGWRDAEASFYSQAYLHAEPGCTVRVRLAKDAADERAWLTIKGKASASGMSRDEFEYAIPVADAEALAAMATAGRVEKWRRVVPVDGLHWEVDEFTGRHAGLVLAEIELESETQTFSRPDWLGEEVTHDARYSNASLAANPYPFEPSGNTD